LTLSIEAPNQSSPAKVKNEDKVYFARWSRVWKFR